MAEEKQLQPLLLLLLLLQLTLLTQLLRLMRLMRRQGGTSLQPTFLSARRCGVYRMRASLLLIADLSLSAAVT